MLSRPTTCYDESNRPFAPMFWLGVRTVTKTYIIKSYPGSGFEILSRWRNQGSKVQYMVGRSSSQGHLSPLISLTLTPFLLGFVEI